MRIVNRGGRLQVLAVASGGGHWIELMRIMPAFASRDGGEGREPGAVSFADCEIAYLTVRADYRSEVGDAPFYTVNDATRWNPLGALLQAVRVYWLLLRLRPGLVVTTGAAPGYFAIRFGKRLGARTIWLDSLANADRLSRSGAMAGRYADLWLTQWPGLASAEGPEYAGQVV